MTATSYLVNRPRRRPDAAIIETYAGPLPLPVCSSQHYNYLIHIILYETLVMILVLYFYRTVNVAAVPLVFVGIVVAGVFIHCYSPMFSELAECLADMLL